MQDKFNNIDPDLDIYIDSARKSTFKPSEAEFYVIRDDILGPIVENWDVGYVTSQINNKRILHIIDCSDLLNRLPSIEIIRVYINLKRKRDLEQAERICRKVYSELKDSEVVKNE